MESAIDMVTTGVRSEKSLKLSCLCDVPMTDTQYLQQYVTVAVAELQQYVTVAVAVAATVRNSSSGRICGHSVGAECGSIDREYGW